HWYSSASATLRRASPVMSVWCFFFFKQKTAYEIGLGIPAEPLFRSSLFLRSASISGLRRDAVQPDIEAERKKRDEIEAGKSYCSRRFGRSEERRVGKECRYRWMRYSQEKMNGHRCRAGIDKS